MGSDVQPKAAYLVTRMMESVLNEGTGAAARSMGFTVEAAGKSGTTNDTRDAWFAGYTPDIVTIVWVGYDDNSPLTGVTGGGLPAEIWHEAMTRIEEGLPARPLPMLVPEIPEFVPPPPVFDSTQPSIGQDELGAIDQLLNDLFGGN